MKICLRILSALFVLFVLLSISSGASVRAASFTSSYDITYDLAEDGMADVTQKVTLTNNTADRYPSDYTLTLKNLKPQEIKAADALGKLETQVTHDEGEGLSRVKVNFNQKALGVGSRLDWNLSFRAPSLAKKNGRLWEITVPLLAEEVRKDVSTYRVQLKIPVSFGQLHLFKPNQIMEVVQEVDKRIYRFDLKDTLVTPSLSLSFGDFQLYDVSLTYHLYNSTRQRVLTEIALPPDFHPFQKVYLKSLDPKPFNLKEDQDSNYLAQYSLNPGQKLDVLYQAQIQVSAIFPPSTLHPPPSNLEPYLLPAKFWEVNNENLKSQISKLKAEYRLDETSSKEDWARAIYNYVTSTLKYNPDRISPDIERFGAVRALQDPQNAVCMEYTDLLIALLRSVGIPARELDGFAMTQDDPSKPTLSDTLHAWVQFFDPPKTAGKSSPEGDGFDFVGWRNIDPTWGSTTGQDYFSTLDTNHIIFVIKGLDSEQPYPAGSYKITGEEQNDVLVSHAANFDQDVIPFRLWWQQEFELEQMSLVDKIGLWLSNLIHQITR